MRINSKILAVLFWIAVINFAFRTSTTSLIILLCTAIIVVLDFVLLHRDVSKGRWPSSYR